MWVTFIHFSHPNILQACPVRTFAFPKAIGFCTGYAKQSEPREPPEAFQGLLDVVAIFFLCTGRMVALGIPRELEK